MSFSKMSSADVFSTYRTAYSTQIDWREIFEEEIIDYLEIFENGRNCSLSLLIRALLALTASLCGPNTKIKCQENGFFTCTNLYVLAVCNPGGRKSATFENVIEPVLRKIYENTGKTIATESYTSAGLQKHQISSGGVGLITSDEGHRFLASMNMKQSKGESERSYLCKMWSGKGDFVYLATGSRGFKKTSMSMCLFIQPQPLIHEMANFCSMDGFFDRLLFFLSRPLSFPTHVVRESYQRLTESAVVDFEETYLKLYLDHPDGTIYKLTQDAQAEYDGLVDSYADLLAEKYRMETEFDENDKENCSDTPLTQTNLCMSSSKDTIHVIRLAVALQITSKYLRYALKKEPVVVDVENDVSVEYLRRGRRLYCYLARQKSIFAQAVESIHGSESVRVKKVTPFKDRVVKAVSLSDGPCVLLRCLQRKLYGSLKDSIIQVLQELEKENFGMMTHIGKNKKDVFLKSSPTHVPQSLLMRTNVDIDQYTKEFKSTRDFDRQLLMMALPLHQHHDEIIDWFNI